MTISEAVRRRVFELDDGKCQFFHSEPTEGTEYCHVVHQGMGGDSPESLVNLEDNGLVSCGKCHRLFHSTGKPWRIVRFDRKEHVLDIVDPDGKEVPKNSLWFYCRQEWSKALEKLGWFRDSVKALRALQWELAKGFDSLKASKLYIAGGYNDIYEFAQELGISSPKVKRMIRLYRFISNELGSDALELDPDIVALLRRVPVTERREMIEIFRNHPLPEAMKDFHDRYGEERMCTFRKFRSEHGKVTYTEMKALREEEVMIEPGEIVVRGGSVIAGAISGDKDDDDKGE